MAKEIISLGVGNEGTVSLDVDVVKTWTPTNVSRIKEIVFFKSEGKFYSMKREDYNRIFEN